MRVQVLCVANAVQLESLYGTHIIWEHMNKWCIYWKAIRINIIAESYISHLLPLFYRIQEEENVQDKWVDMSCESKSQFINNFFTLTQTLGKSVN